MTTITERIQLDEITAQAREVHLGRSLLTVVAAVLFGIGWLVARMFFCVAWCGMAVKVGWQEGRNPGQVAGGPGRAG